MKSAPLLLLFCFVTVGLFAQEYEPQILILTPKETTIDKKFDRDAARANDALKKTSTASELQQYVKTEEFKTQAENIKTMTLAEVKFVEQLDFSKLASYTSFQYLSYRFFERFTNLMILLSDQKSSGSAAELKAIGGKANLQYVLNFPKVEVYKTDGVGYARIRIQLYDHAAGQFIIDKEYIGNWNNPGFEFTCTDESIQCTINNALSQGLTDVIQAIATESPTLRRERDLAQRRYEKLTVNHLSKPYDVRFLKGILQHAKDLSVENVFQVLYDDTKTKFVAFSVEKAGKKDFKSLTQDKKDKNINIISNKDIKDEAFLDAVPQMYGFIIKGVMHEDKWYYEKGNVTYFGAENIDEARKKYFNNLQRWGFFEENSDLASPNFWETGLFKKVRDLKQDPQWEKYGQSIWETEEVNNRPYIGMYEIVASVKKQNAKEASEKFKSFINDNKLKPFYEQLKAKNPKTYASISNHSLIFPSDQSIVINPVMVTNDKGVKTVRCFVLILKTDELFEWTHFKPVEIKGYGYTGSTVVDHINKTTKWNFAYPSLDDKDFWEKYVLLKEGGTYKYLNKVL